MTTQLSIFDFLGTEQLTTQQRFANAILDILNSLNTNHKGLFKIVEVDVSVWEQQKYENLSITLTSTISDFNENSFTYFCSRETEESFNEQLFENTVIKELYKDDDFKIVLSPQLVHVYYHNFKSEDVSFI